MSPDLDDIRELCKERKHESLLLQNYSEMMLGAAAASDSKNHSDSTTASAQNAQIAKLAKKGTRSELIGYLVAEAGAEIEFVWRTRYFYISGQIKTEELG